MDIKAIIQGWLKEHGYDGLFNRDAQCGCESEDLAPCEGDITACEPGYKVPCDGKGCECVEPHTDWHIQQDKGA